MILAFKIVFWGRAPPLGLLSALFSFTSISRIDNEHPVGGGSTRVQCITVAPPAVDLKKKVSIVTPE